MDTFDYGKYTFCDMDIGNKKDIELSRLRNEKFGFISNSIKLIPELNLFENVGIPLLYSKFSKEEKRERRGRACHGDGGGAGEESSGSEKGYGGERYDSKRYSSERHGNSCC